MLKSKQEDNKLFRVRISKNMLGELNDVIDDARRKDLEFPTAEIVEKALKKALKTTKVEFGLTEGKKAHTRFN